MNVIAGVGLWFILAAVTQVEPWSSRWWLLLIGSVMVGVVLTAAIRERRGS